MTQLHNFFSRLPWYAAWHQKNHASTVHWSVLAAVTFVALNIVSVQIPEAVSATKFTCADISGSTDIRKHDSAVAKTSKDLFRKDNAEAKKRGKSFSAITIADQKTLVARKKHLTDLMRNDPDAAAQELFSSSSTEQVVSAEGSENCIEQSVVEEGRVGIYHVDYTDDTAGEFFNMMNDAGKLTTIHLPTKFGGKVRVAGEYIRVVGKRMGNEIVPDISRDDGVTIVPQKHSLLDFFKNFVKTAYASIASSMGPQKTLVIMAYFQDKPKPPISQGAASDMVFNQVNDFYLHTSYGKTSYVGNSFDWVQVPMNETCAPIDVMNLAITAVAPPNPQTYQQVVLLAPFGEKCGTRGGGGWGQVLSLDKELMGTMWLNTSAWSQGTVIPPLQYFAHELGHSLGVWHSNFLSCGSGVVVTDTIGTGCQSLEYGEPFDVMGNMVGEMNAPHRDYIGWFDPSNVKRVLQSGTYTVEPLETPTTGLKALRIPRSANPDDDLYLEYRQPIGYDANFISQTGGTDVYTGALLHALGGWKPRMLDATPLPNSQYFPALVPGHTMIDPISGTSIKVVGTTTSSLTALVTIGKTDFTPPTITSVAPANASLVRGVVSISLSATSVSGIRKVEFYDQDALTPFAVDTSAPWGATWNSVSVADGVRTLQIRVYDKSGDAFSVPDNVALLPLALSVTNDATPPSAQVTSPQGGSRVNSPISVTVSANDNIGVVRTEIWKDADQTPSASVLRGGYNSFVIPMSVGTHAVYAKAYDLAGNVGISPSVSFAVIDAPKITWTSPASGTIAPINSTLTLAVTATAAQGVLGVHFTGTGLDCWAETLPYTCPWTTPSVGGTQTIIATAYDSLQNFSTSSMAVTVVAEPKLMSATSRKIQGAAGTFDLPLSLTSTNPTTEPRQNATSTIVMNFDAPVIAANVAITEGAAVVGSITLGSTGVIIPLTGVVDKQYVTIKLTNICSTLVCGGTATVRIGFLVGDVNQSRSVTLSDVGLVNQQIAQLVTTANYKMDVNANGAITLGDKGITNNAVTKALPTP